jgi:GNAT superfamily N-acetyltransferase
MPHGSCQSGLRRVLYFGTVNGAMIRRLSREDWPEWRRMRAALWPDCLPEMHELEMTEQSAASDGAVFVHQRPDSSLGGFIELSIRDRVDGSFSPRVGYIEGWYVDPDLRGSGIGRQLVECAAEMGPAAWAERIGQRRGDCQRGKYPRASGTGLPRDVPAGPLPEAGPDLMGFPGRKSFLGG